MDLHWEILDEKRLGMVAKLRPFKKNFYLAGGTALALQIGHRTSMDFDFFSTVDFNHADVLDLSR